MRFFRGPYNTRHDRRSLFRGVLSVLAMSLLALSPLLATLPADGATSSRGASSKKSSKKKVRRRSRKRTRSSYRRSANRRYKYAKRSRHRKRKRRRRASRPIPPQNYLDKLNKLTLKPGLIFWSYRGPLVINIVELDMNNTNLEVRPYLASESFDKLKAVKTHAAESGALVAVNANYFKYDGTPLGAIKMDGEWVSGSLYNRVAMGITRDREVKFARVNLHGVINTSNPHVPSLWVNNMNQPRRTGARLILYTPRWGATARLAYDGTVVAVDGTGRVVDKHSRSVRIPPGGYALTDRKESKTALLRVGDLLHLEWQTNPRHWNDVEHAISGGPTLIKNGKLHVGLKSEKFRMSWTSHKITHRTACGVTKHGKLILATVEGPHNMWDLAKFMHKMGCVEAMNLDGGGSTTMVVNGTTVTRNFTGGQRKVATTLTIMEPHVAGRHMRITDRRYRPQSNLIEFITRKEVESTILAGSDELRSQMDELAILTCSNPSRSQELERLSSLGSGILCENRDNDDVIDIDNDLVDEEQEPLPAVEEIGMDRKRVPDKAAGEGLGTKRTGKRKWTRRLLNPFGGKKQS